MSENVALNKIVAVVAGRKSTTQKDLSALYHTLQRGDGMTGHTKTYRPADAEGQNLPNDNRLVQANVRDTLIQVADVTTGLLDAVATQDFGNTEANADIVVNDKTVAWNVPVPYLLYLEQRLKEIAAVVDKIPTLDLDKVWKENGDGTYSSEPVESHRTQRVSEPIVLYPATEEHPAQTQLVERDNVVGFWTTTHQSGAMPVSERDALRSRVRDLTDAVKSAREDANATEVLQQQIGENLMSFLFDS